VLRHVPETLPRDESAFVTGTELVIDGGILA
jgi:hypothetical protein